MSPSIAGRRAHTGLRISQSAVRLLTVSAVALLTACGGSKSASSVTSPNVGPAASISLSVATGTLTVGDTLRVGAVVYDKSSNVVTGDTLTWTTSDSTVAVVSDSGTVTALAAGTVTIRARIDSIVGSAALTVAAPATRPFVGLAAVAAGFAHSCALDSAGSAYCWGSNADGQLGNDTIASSPFPIAVSGSLTFASLTAGYGHTCGLTANGTAYCWGDNASGALGSTTSALTSGTPVAVAGGLRFAMLSAGYAHTCGVTTAGAAYCWGADESGELGNGAYGQSSATPVLVTGGLTFASVSAGGVFTCGVTTAGAGYCWGSNAYGVLGNGTTDDSATPVAVAGGLTLASISAGVYHACAVTTNGAAYCWGDAANGQLGTGLTSMNAATPMAVAGGQTFTAVTTGELSSCATTVSGAAYCWGSGSFGSLGTGASTESAVPQPVSGGTVFTSLSAGISFHVCGLTTGGTAACWGYDDSGELGDGAAGGFSVTPQEVVVRNN